MAAQNSTPKWQLWTGYYRTAGHEPHAVGISRGVPAGWQGRRYLVLVPSWAMLRMSNENYDRAYAELLAKLDPRQVADDLNGTILLCFEPRPEHCHRLTVANWLRAALGAGIVVEEWESDSTISANLRISDQ